MTAPSVPAPALPERIRAYLAADELAPLWAQVRTRLESNGLEVTGAVTLTLDTAAAHAVAGVLGKPVAPGKRRLALAELDTALRASAAGRGLIAVVAELTGEVHNRKQARTDAQTARADLWAGVDAALAAARLSGAAWVPDWLRWLHTGVLTRAGTDAATAVAHAAATLGRLADTTAPWLRSPPTAEGLDDPSADPTGDASPWMLAQLASTTTADAHGLDADRPAAVLALRAVALATGARPAKSAAQRRRRWAGVGVEADTLSATVLVWNLRPPGPDPWSAMMRSRAELGAVTALTLQELDLAGPVPLAGPAQVVYACENPQVMQAAAQQQVPATLVCLSGQPSTAGGRLLYALQRAGARVLYHGDFDWPGVAIASRLVARGARTWRMDVGDYLDALDRLEAGTGVPLAGTPVTPLWDQALGTQMRRAGIAVHEESVLDDLLADLRKAPAGSGAAAHPRRRPRQDRAPGRRHLTDET